MEVALSETFILGTGKPGMYTSQTFICCEVQIYIESKSVHDVILDLISTYFVFDIAYPEIICNILIVLQHYVFNLPDKQTASSIVKTLVTNLEKLLNTINNVCVCCSLFTIIYICFLLVLACNNYCTLCI